MFNLKDKKALITGASSGIGEAIAYKFIKAGAKVIITGTNEEKLQNVQKKLGDNSQYVICDLSNSEKIQELISKYCGDIDILVCNAGITADNIFMRMTDEQWHSVINVNLTANFKIIKGAIKGMMKKRFGRIITISSIVGATGNPGQANYCASKGGIVSMTKSIALEVATRGITANSISPGFIATNMTEKLTDAQKTAILSKIPAGKMGVSEDIANASLFLASDESSYITGQNLHVNGGMYTG